MAQDFRTIQGTDLLSDSREYINDNFEATRTFFAGALAPTTTVAYMLWFDTTSGYIKERNAGNDAWIIIGKLGTVNRGLLSLAGGTMTGPLDMGAQVITNVGLGTGTAVARVQEVDLKAPIAAPTFTGDAKVSQDPAGNDSIPRRSWTDARYVKLAGGTMTGPLILSGIATADLHPAGFKQVKDLVTFNITTGHRHDGSDSRKIKGSSVDAEASIIGAVLQSDGAGSAVWSAVAADKCVMGDDQTLIVTRTTTIAWTNVSLAAYVPADAGVAVLKVDLDVVSAGSFVAALRPAGSSTVIPQEWSGATGTLHQVTTMVRLTTRQFEYKLDASGSGTLRIYLLGYLRTT